jgi:GNAT superfamily N-acetyltransferase
MTIEMVPADQVSLKEQARIFTEAFAGYVGGSFAMDEAGLARFICAQGAEICHSRFARNELGLCGFAYIGRTGNVSRICGMGVIPATRRGGIARQLLEGVITEAENRGDEAIVLEVIEQNPGAHELYKHAGFREIDRLEGWRRSAESEVADESPDLSGIKETSLTCAIQLPSAFESPDLPWQVSRHAVAKLASVRAYSCGRATVVISDPMTAGPIRIHALAVPESTDKWPAMREALRAVLQAFPGREFFAPPLFPEMFGREVFGPLNFAREPLSQFLMRREIKSLSESPRRPVSPAI